MTNPILYSAPEERYTDHIDRCLERFDIIFPFWKSTIRRIFCLSTQDDIESLLRQIIIFHDLGKLTKRWQDNIGTNKKLPSHAPIGAAYLYKRLSQLCQENLQNDFKNAIVFAVLIHHTDSGLLGDNIERPDVQAIMDGVVDNDGKIIWADKTEGLEEKFFPKELNDLMVNDLKMMARGLRIWARSGGFLEQHRKRIQASLVHHILKLCDISAATERKEYQKKDEENYYGGWLMCNKIREYVENLLKKGGNNV